MKIVNKPHPFRGSQNFVTLLYDLSQIMGPESYLNEKLLNGKKFYVSKLYQKGTMEQGNSPP